jgi:hypothetical protein
MEVCSFAPSKVQQRLGRAKTGVALPWRKLLVSRRQPRRILFRVAVVTDRRKGIEHASSPGLDLGRTDDAID